MVCRNHPQKATKRRCRACETPVCKQCTVKSSGDVFCSEACLRDWADAQKNQPRVPKKPRKKGVPRRAGAAKAAPAPNSAPAEVTPEITPEITPEVTPEVTPAVTDEALSARPAETSESSADAMLPAAVEPAGPDFPTEPPSPLETADNRGPADAECTPPGTADEESAAAADPYAFPAKAFVYPVDAVADPVLDPLDAHPAMSADLAIHTSDGAHGAPDSEDPPPEAVLTPPPAELSPWVALPAGAHVPPETGPQPEPPAPPSTVTTPRTPYPPPATGSIAAPVLPISPSGLPGVRAARAAVSPGGPAQPIIPTPPPRPPGRLALPVLPAPPAVHGSPAVRRPSATTPRTVNHDCVPSPIVPAPPDASMAVRTAWQARPTEDLGPIVPAPPAAAPVPAGRWLAPIAQAPFAAAAVATAESDAPVYPTLPFSASDAAAADAAPTPAIAPPNIEIPAASSKTRVEESAVDSSVSTAASRTHVRQPGPRAPRLVWTGAKTAPVRRSPPYLLGAVLLQALLLVAAGVLLLRMPSEEDKSRAGRATPTLAPLPDGPLLVPPIVPELVPRLVNVPKAALTTDIVVRGTTETAGDVLLFFNGAPVTVATLAEQFVSGRLRLEPGRNMLQPAIRIGAQTHYGPAVAVMRPVEKRPTPILPPSSGTRLGPNVTRVPAAGQAVSFTFDGGSSANAATEIFATLRERNLRTTMFLTGEFIERFPEMVRQALADGHEIGNHMFTHPHLTTFNQNQRHDRLPHVTREWFQKQLNDTARAYRKVTGREMAPLWRAPYGEVNEEIRTWAKELGYRHIGWTSNRDIGTLDSLDWVTDKASPLYRSGDAFRTRFLRLAEHGGEPIHGAIILMHLGTERRSDALHRQLPAILDGYHARGYTILPITELLTGSGPAALSRFGER